MLTAEHILENKGGKIISVDIEATVADALKIMLENKIGAILITEGEEIKGIWTERDLMKNVVTEGFYSKTSKIKDVMTTNLISSPYTDSLYQLMDKCLGRRLRHLLIEKDGKYIGLLSAGDITRAHLMKKSSELEELNKMANWDYYENWKFSKK
ncbi:MAG: CBS domain-containing protein [Melioribacteraceae bacterium]|nr:CBS domain-containing protein [Melioribacteraceae bacterium]